MREIYDRRIATWFLGHLHIDAARLRRAIRSDDENVPTAADSLSLRNSQAVFAGE